MRAGSLGIPRRGRVLHPRKATFTLGDVDSEPRADVAQRHLSTFAGYLFERGWQPDDHGAHWWSLLLVRPRLQWPEQVVGGVHLENVCPQPDAVSLAGAPAAIHGQG